VHVDVRQRRRDGPQHHGRGPVAVLHACRHEAHAESRGDQRAGRVEVVHFVGDVHQPLHSLTNGDRGGNCLPITYYGRSYHEGKKITWRDGASALWTLIKYRFTD